MRHVVKQYCNISSSGTDGYKAHTTILPLLPNPLTRQSQDTSQICPHFIPLAKAAIYTR